jgi:hypothetical protein
MDIPLLIAIITSSVTLAGWLTNHVLTGRRDRANQRLAVSLKFVERQLEELYGPLAFLVIESRRASIDFVDALGREPFFEGEHALDKEEVKLWLLWTEHNFLPHNEKIQQLLMTKTHLIEGDKVPISFVEFIEYYNSWKMAHLRWKEHGAEYNWHSKVSWPTSFDEEVLNTFSILKLRHNKIAAKIYK